jgi:hypothetical protein
MAHSSRVAPICVCVSQVAISNHVWLIEHLNYSLIEQLRAEFLLFLLANLDLNLNGHEWLVVTTFDCGLR